MLGCVLSEFVYVVAIRLYEADECVPGDEHGQGVHLSSIPDEQESRGVDLVLDRGPRGERVDEELDLSGVVLVHDRPRHGRGTLVENDVLDESWDRQSAQLSVQDKRTCFRGARGRSASLTRWRGSHSRSCSASMANEGNTDFPGNSLAISRDNFLLVVVVVHVHAD